MDPEVAVWELAWESSEAMCYLLGRCDLTGVSVVELGCGAFARCGRAAAAAGAQVVVTDGVAEAVRRATTESGLPGRVLDWTRADASLVERPRLAIGSDLWYDAVHGDLMLAMLLRDTVPLLLFSSPARAPFHVFAARVAEAFAFCVCARVAPPCCEPTLMLVAARSGEDELAHRMAALMREHECAVQRPDCSSAPPPPPPPCW